MGPGGRSDEQFGVIRDTFVASQEPLQPNPVRNCAIGYHPFVDQSPEQSPGSPAVGKPRDSAARRPTRISWAWITLILGVILGVALVDFLVQNTRSVRVEFFSASGQIPVVVALLVAALAGAAVALVVGGARIGQLRRRLRHSTATPSAKSDAPVSETSPPPNHKAA
jgi:uncharacterized integral membrane protein